MKNNIIEVRSNWLTIRLSDKTVTKYKQLRETLLTGMGIEPDENGYISAEKCKPFADAMRELNVCIFEDYINQPWWINIFLYKKDLWTIFPEYPHTQINNLAFHSEYDAPIKVISI